MLFEGIKLLILGMTTVMLFLSLMILFINLVSLLTKTEREKELSRLEEMRKLQAIKRMQEQRKKDAQAELTAGTAAEDDIAAITAAVAVYEAERFAAAA